MRAINLKTNHLTAPVGIDAGPLFLSWQCADGVRQTAYEIELTHVPAKAPMRKSWHSSSLPLPFILPQHAFGTKNSTRG